MPNFEGESINELENRLSVNEMWCVEGNDMCPQLSWCYICAKKDF